MKILQLHYNYICNYIIIMSNDNKSKSDDANDSEDIFDTSSPDDITSLLCPNFSTVKKSIFLFILFILISTDVFIDRMLSTKDHKYAEAGHCTTNGTLVQGVILILGYILIDTLVEMDCV